MLRNQTCFSFYLSNNITLVRLGISTSDFSDILKIDNIVIETDVRKYCSSPQPTIMITASCFFGKSTNKTFCELDNVLIQRT